jgi:bacteriocin-like protein
MKKQPLKLNRQTIATLTTLSTKELQNVRGGSDDGTDGLSGDNVRQRTRTNLCDGDQMCNQ